ncbi:uncharacterized protein [Onthophagus taurus]|uniref:uncharacterized protein isoform X2 n=1 Tax=Onthophagus taurus TaxID=166361 RepID=UPI000C205D54|nr:uncharacterized protein LOC111428264 isoform X2 [Onthophagus taurus]
MNGVILLISFSITTNFFKGSQCLKDVKLNIDPATVKLYHDTILHCTYDLEGASLYSVKWYRGQREFYRYTPTESTKVKVFAIEGFTVDGAASNSTQVYLRNISDFKHSGNFSCEVTADGNTVFERRDEQTMQVVQLPEHEPKISVGRDPLDVGDVLKANCSSPPSKPRAEMTMSLNNFVIKMSDLSKQKPISHPDWSDLSVEIKLTEHYFKDNGDLKLECVAKVAGIYSDNAVLFLESARRHPVPERVSYNIASAITKNTAICLIGFVFSYLVLD